MKEVIQTNEIAEVNFQMPDTIDDLTKWDMFFSARIPLYKKLLKGVKSWDEASEEEKRILRRAQEEAENLIDIHMVMGDLYKNLPNVRTGRPAESADINDGTFTPKQGFRNQTGLSEKKAQRLVTISDNQDIVAEVKAEAKENNELPTEKEILKRIDMAKKAERARLEAELAEKDKRIEYLERDSKEREDYIIELESREPEVKTVEVVKEIVKEVVPDDIKRKAEMSEAHEKDFRTMQKAYEEMSEKWKQAEAEKKRLIDEANKPEVERAEKIRTSALMFCAGVSNFIEKYGGYVWLTEHINEMEPKERKGYLGAINAVESWVTAIKANMEGVTEWQKK